jgi:glycolate oxidase FAD binding subunit
MIALSGAVADWEELSPDDATYVVDGLHPRYVCSPASVEEMAAAVRAAHEAVAAVVPWGGGTRVSIGFPPRAADLVVRTERLSEIVEYEPADLTVTVQAGIRLGALQERLRAEGQMLALDPAAADRATIGGIIAANASGPLRYLYGSARDLVIGTRVVNADGVISKAGGRVVKNVAGYDLNKLYVGSLGTLGIVVELSFKLHPLPQSEGVLLASFASIEAAAEAIAKIYRSPLNPAAIELLDARAAVEVRPDLRIAESGCLLVAVGAGFEKAVDRQLRDMGEMCGAAETQTVRDTDSIQPIWRGLRELADPSAAGIALLKAAVPPARSAAALGVLRRAATDLGFSPALQARAGTGVVYLRLAPAAWGAETIAALVTLVGRARDYARGESGSVVVEACPTEAKRDLDVWGDPGNAFSVMQALKRNLDPKGTLNPGRFVGRL